MRKSKEPANHISDEDKMAFLAAIKNGFGLTKGAGFILKTPQKVTEILREHKAFYSECESAVKFAAKALLLIANKDLTESKFDKYKINRGFAAKFITSINLWECFSTKPQLTPVKITQAIISYRDLDEVATACGLTRAELNEYMLTYPDINTYLKENPHLLS